jgi:hypothetical protein
MQVEARRGVCGCATPGTIAEGGEEDVSGTPIGTVLSAGIVDVFSDEVVNAADPWPPTWRLSRGLSPIRPRGAAGFIANRVRSRLTAGGSRIRTVSTA